MTHLAYVALGSNLGERAQNLRAAIAALDALPGTHVNAASSMYVSAAMGADEPQPDYFNGVVGLDTALAPHALLAALQQIEHAAGRTRIAGVSNTARTLDLDLLLFDDLVIADHGLRVPHPLLQDRAFVLLPLLEIAPGCVVPGRGPARDMLPRVASQRIARVAEPAIPA